MHAARTYLQLCPIDISVQSAVQCKYADANVSQSFASYCRSSFGDKRVYCRLHANEIEIRLSRTDPVPFLDPALPLASLDESKNYKQIVIYIWYLLVSSLPRRRRRHELCVRSCGAFVGIDSSCFLVCTRTLYRLSLLGPFLSSAIEIAVFQLRLINFYCLTFCLFV